MALLGISLFYRDTQMQFTLAELTKNLDVTIKGDPESVIRGVCPIQQSAPGFITFLTNSSYRKYLKSTQAAAVILSEKDVVDCPVNAVVSRNPYYTYAKIASFFEKHIRAEQGVHATAVIGMGCHIAPTASVAAGCVIGDGVTISANVIIGPGVMIGNDVHIGMGSRIDARVTIYHNVRIGERVRVMSGAVIGSDGFGFANHQGKWHKVPQLGSVVIGDDVDIGSNTTIDRGAIENTIIESGVTLDNLIQVGHNVHIGANTIIAGCVAIAGSTQIGKNCMIGGGSCFAGHIQVCDNVILTGMSAVTKSITEPGMYSSGVVGVVPNKEFLKNNARFHRLGNLMQRVKTLESELESLKERQSS